VAEACCCRSLDFAYRGLRGLSATSEHERAVIDLLGNNDADDQRTTFSCQLNVTRGSGLDNKEIHWSIDNVDKETTLTK